MPRLPDAPRPRVLVLASTAVGSDLLGAALRSYELARALQPHADVELAMPDAPEAPPPGVDWTLFAHQDPSTLQPYLDRADAVIAQPQWPAVHRLLRRSGKRLVFDVYVPQPFELLELGADLPLSRRRVTQAFALDRLRNAMADGHHLACASERQRDLWIGFLLGLGAITPARYDRDPELRTALDVVPLGVPAEPPVAVPGAGIRAALPQIGPDDEVVLWNGGIWDWLDADSVVDAIAQLHARRPSVRLVFMGRSRHEAAAAATARMEEKARALGLLGDVVVVNESWVPYAQRGTWLLEADCAVSCHVDHLETRFAFRTRLTDCLWAGLPVVCTEGDDLATRIAEQRLGESVPERDPAAIAAAIERVLDEGRDSYAPRMARAAAELTWPRVVEPIVRWLGEPVPPRIGAGRPPSQRTRDGAYAGARAALNAVGLRRWPN